MSQGGKGLGLFRERLDAPQSRLSTGLASAALGAPKCIRSGPRTSMSAAVRFAVRRHPVVAEFPNADPST
ncbi:MAG: hypothetical protein ABSE63_14235 [Thermoguttaceae bacterium]